MIYKLKVDTRYYLPKGDNSTFKGNILKNVKDETRTKENFLIGKWQFRQSYTHVYTFQSEAIIFIQFNFRHKHGLTEVIIRLNRLADW